MSMAGMNQPGGGAAAATTAAQQLQPPPAAGPLPHQQRLFPGWNTVGHRAVEYGNTAMAQAGTSGPAMMERMVDASVMLGGGIMGWKMRRLPGAAVGAAAGAALVFMPKRTPVGANPFLPYRSPLLSVARLYAGVWGTALLLGSCLEAIGAPKEKVWGSLF